MSSIPKVKLDWSRLLGFDQASTKVADADAAAHLHDPRLAMLGVKPGPKPCPAPDRGRPRRLDRIPAIG